MSFLPIFLDTSAGTIALAGSGHAALAKLRLLRTMGANVRWFPCAVEVVDEALSAPGTGMLEVSHDDPLTAEFSGVVAIVSSAGKGIDEALSRRARALGLPVNVVDRMDLSSFIFPAIVERGDVVIAIGTGGTSPVIARRLREKLEALLPARIGDLSALIGRYRARFVAAKQAVSARVFWEQVIDGPIGALMLSGRAQEAEAKLVAAIDAPSNSASQKIGTVYLVGAGPGDPDLLTLKAAQALADADIIFHDDLVDQNVLDRARRDAEQIFVGKRRGQPGTSQDDINAMLVEAAQRGKRVVRLKGGDPFIFGRGGEELEALRAAGVPVVVVPGITAALGCAAEAGLPLTYRNEATQLAIITAHRADAAASIDWRTLADPQITVAVYMGLQSAAAVREGLLGAGRSGQTPVAVLSRGTRANCHAVVGRLDGLTAVAASAGSGPALLVIGDVVAHSDAWRALEALAAKAA